MSYQCLKKKFKQQSKLSTFLNLLKNWQKNLRQNWCYSNSSYGLSKACHCLPHDLLIDKLAAYGFEDSGPSLISDYLSKRSQRVEIGSAFSSYLEILRGVPQDSI